MTEEKTNQEGTPREEPSKPPEQAPKKPAKPSEELPTFTPMPGRGPDYVSKVEDRKELNKLAEKKPPKKKSD